MFPPISPRAKARWKGKDIKDMATILEEERKKAKKAMHNFAEQTLDGIRLGNIDVDLSVNSMADRNHQGGSAAGAKAACEEKGADGEEISSIEPSAEMLLKLACER